MIDAFNNNSLPRGSNRKKKGKSPTGGKLFLNGLRPKKNAANANDVAVNPNEDPTNLDDSRPSETPTFESNNSKSGWKKFVGKIRTYTKKTFPAQTNTTTTATKTPNPSLHEEETKKDEEELNVQIIEDNE